MTPTPTRAVAYIRVSTQKQADHGVSLSAQQAKLKAYASVYDLHIVEYIVDPAESAGTLNRPGLTRALAMLGKQADALLVIKLDRLTRSVRDLSHLLERYFMKYSLLSVSEQLDTRSAGGRMMLNLLTVIGQWERETAGERTRAAKQYQRSQHRYIGGTPPYGSRVVDGQLVPHPEEQRMLEDIRTRMQLGETPTSIARGMRTRQGTPMAAYQIRRLVAGG